MRGALFDFDGVIVDSEPLHFGALRDALVPEGIHIDEDEYRKSYLAYDDRGSIRLALEQHGRDASLERVARIVTRKAAAFEALIPSVPFFPGARELVRALAREVPVGIASGALRSEIEAILGQGGLLDAFSAIVGAEDVRQGKPHPEPYLTAMARLDTGLRPGECLVFEDSMPGVAAARAAGMKVVAVTNSYPAAKLRSADRVVESLAGLDPGGLRALFEP
ncbi:MAG TPA: HAD family phosphatase [Vicinamibacteria bacterium]|nr:HAD family phosphatase [Vicinamibacteria bacterium]